MSSFRWISCAGPKPKRRFWFGGCAQYCQRMTSAPMRANASWRVDRVPPRAVHLAALSRRASSRSRAPLGRRPAGQRDRHEELRVEPEPDLLAHLRDPVGREPLLPVRVVGEVGRREPLGRARGVALRRRTRGSPSRASRTGRCRRRARRRRPRGSARTSSPHASQRIGTSSIHGRRSSSSCSSPADRPLLELGLASRRR